MTHPALRIASDTASVDLEAAQRAAAGFLTALGVDLAREELRETPARMERPPLSKDYLMGKAERDSGYVHPQDWHPEHDVGLRLGAAVTSIDRERHEVTLADGSHVGYAKLLLATGSSPRPLLVPGPACRASTTCARSATVTGSGRPSAARDA